MSSRRYLAPLVLVPVIAAALLWLFAWPAARVEPRSLPVGVSGSNTAVVNLEGRLDVTAGSTSFDVHRYHDERAARSAIEHRDIYGAVVLAPKGTTVLTASAASPTVAALLQHAFAAPAGASAGLVRVVDVAPLPPADPRGGAFASTLLPLLIAGMAGAHLSVSLARTFKQRVGVLTGAAILTGVVTALLAQTWLGYLAGDWSANAGIIAFTALAVSSVVAGLAALGRGAGIGAGAVLMVLIGNAASGATTAPELLPGAIAWIGRLLPPGAGVGALRGTAFFHGNGIGLDVAVLASWSVLGLGLMTLGARLAKSRTHPHGAHAHGARPAGAGVAAEGVSADTFAPGRPGAGAASTQSLFGGADAQSVPFQGHTPGTVPPGLDDVPLTATAPPT